MLATAGRRCLRSFIAYEEKIATVALSRVRPPETGVIPKIDVPTLRKDDQVLAHLHNALRDARSVRSLKEPEMVHI